MVKVLKADRTKKITFLSSKIRNSRIIKKSRARVAISDYKAPSILGDKNRFFRNEWNSEMEESI